MERKRRRMIEEKFKELMKQREEATPKIVKVPGLTKEKKQQ